MEARWAKTTATHMAGFPCGSAIKNLPARTGDMGLIPRLGRSPGAGNGNLLQYSCLGNPMNRGACGLQSMGSQGVRHDLATKQQQQLIMAKS